MVPLRVKIGLIFTSFILMLVAAVPAYATVSVNNVNDTSPEGVAPNDTNFLKDFGLDSSSRQANTVAKFGTNNRKPKISAYTKRGATVWIFVSSTDQQGYTVTSDAKDGYFEKTLEQPLANGLHHVYFQIADNKGNYSGRILGMEVSVDPNAPAAGGTTSTVNQLAQAGDRMALPLLALAAILVGAGSYMLIRRSR